MVPMSPAHTENEDGGDAEAKQLRWRSNLSGGHANNDDDHAELREQQERWKKVSEVERSTEGVCIVEQGVHVISSFFISAFSRSNFMAHANSLQHRGGLDFFALARGGERSYSTSFLVNLDPDLLTLCAGEHKSAYDLSLDALIGHTNRIFRMVQAKSKRDVNQVQNYYYYYYYLYR